MIQDLFKLKSFLYVGLGKTFASTQPDQSASRQLPSDFEQATGITGISRPYLFPDQKKACDYDLWAATTCSWKQGDDEKQTGFLKSEWAKLVELNPILTSVNPGNEPKFLRNAIFGAATLFNPDDIRFFIDVQRRTQCSRVALLVHQIPAHRELVGAIESRTNETIQWVPSPVTLVSIYRQVKDRPVLYSIPKHFSKAEELSSAEIKAAHTFIHCPSIVTL